ncbi:MbtH family NRPS accessory protein [Streptomyces sp. RY43-2]|uniref:MbtH family NRPS accessory protein n=1 Tax=Streptomyces macrolidinus TaxID=2952607 RepID=A0ABT0ZIX2_9ACTN|nr:MbtH family NRPS accessory protein [Streptomyces macrolidinus]MCN9243547.1 MbtH family NRPS accessory protein [Streptomyces macrolidinus]
MIAHEASDTELFQVLVNDEGQHSLWSADLQVPAGWKAVGPTGTKAVCMAYVDESWTDMRPLSLQLAARQEETVAGSDD